MVMMAAKYPWVLDFEAFGKKSWLGIMILEAGAQLASDGKGIVRECWCEGRYTAGYFTDSTFVGWL